MEDEYPIKTKLEEMNKTEKGLKLEVIKYILENYETDDQIKTFSEDLENHGCSSGMIDILVYYEDTNNFFDKYEDEIEELLEEFRENCGYKSRPEAIMNLNGNAEDISQEKNLLAWFGFEETARQLQEEVIK